ncbi:MAG TPA: hypothetical protein VFW45_14355 [Candidatus Polarisedimenticolia bacterium]|nr:hypothetical protein [Candidatus Polarisedimenticolia bacterium]
MIPHVGRASARRSRAAILLVALGSLAACQWACSAPSESPSTSGVTPGTPSDPVGQGPPLPSLAAYRESVQRARSWLDTLHVDPAELRAHGIKGKKKLVELLDAYYELWKVAPPREREVLMARIREVVKVTYEPAYHDMLTIRDEWFKQDATSYLRAALLMERLGLDISMYRAEIAKIHDRLDAHMRERGPHQREVFHWYYRDFGLSEPFPLEEARNEGVIAHRENPAVMSDPQVYELTHEIYAPFEYGDKRDVNPFDGSERSYLRNTLDRLLRRYLARKDPDLVAELLECEHYLMMDDGPASREAVTYLLESQNQDGSWGSYPRQRRLLGDYVKQGFELHTTMVVIGALAVEYEKRVS